MKTLLKKTLIIARRCSVNFKPILHSQPRDSFKSNITINQNIMNTKNCEDLIQIVGSTLQKMNMINLCTSFNVLLKFQNNLISNPNRISFLGNLLDRTYDLAFNLPFSEYNARPLSNLYFFFNKLIENKAVFSQVETFNDLSIKINMILEKKIPVMIENMNDQEISNVIYTLAQRKKIDNIIAMNDLIIQKFQNYSFKSNLMIFYSYSSLDINVPAVYKGLDEWFIKNIKLQKINGHDFSQLIFAYSKINNIITESKIFDYFNQTHVFLYNEINILSLSTIFHALTRFQKPLMSKEFYEKYQAKIIENMHNLNDRMLSNILRGFGKWNYGTDSFYIKMEGKCIERCEFLDYKIYSSILHSYATNLKGSFKLYEVFEKNFLKRMEKNGGSDFTNNNLLYIFYSFTHIKETYPCSNETKEFFKNIFIQRMDDLNMDELAPITAMYSTFIKENQPFFLSLTKLLLKKQIPIAKIKNLAEITKSYALHASSLYDKDLIDYFSMNLANVLEKEAESKKSLSTFKDRDFFNHLAKTLFSFLKYEPIRNYSDIYQKVANLMEEMCSLNSENATVLFQEPSILFFFKQSFAKMNIKHEFLLKYES